MDKTLRDWPAFTSHFTLPMRFLRQGREGQGTVILLHGYQDHALSMTRRLGWLDREDLPFQILAVNAPFPVPVWKADGFVEAYSWYFRDTSRDLMIVNPLDTAAQVARLVRENLLPNRPLALLGFSQGGYLAPYLAHHLPEVRAIIAIGSGYPAEPYSRLQPLPVFGLHGASDDRWPIEASQSAHAELLKRGFKGEFHIVPDLGHKVDPVLDPYIRGFLNTAWGSGK